MLYRVPVAAVSPLSLTVFEASALRVISGVNCGDAVAQAPDLGLGDEVALDRGAVPFQLALEAAPDDGLSPGTEYKIAAGSEAGLAQEITRIGDELVLVRQDGLTLRLILLTTAPEGRPALAKTWALPLGPLTPLMPCTLISATPSAQHMPRAAVQSGGLARGTLITMAAGGQKPVEDLLPGERVLTCKSGPQPLRSVLHKRSHAAGHLAPVVLSAGVMGCTSELTLDPYQRIWSGNAEAPGFIPARLAVDNVAVNHRRGGFVDYVTLVLDLPDMVIANGIAVECLPQAVQMPAAGLSASSEETVKLRERPYLSLVGGADPLSETRRTGTR